MLGSRPYLHSPALFVSFILSMYEVAQELPLGRSYKSRKARPCDGCRQRKVACDMPSGPPCTRCQKLSHSCLFIEKPSKRKRCGQERAEHQADIYSPSLTDFLNGFVHPDDPEDGGRRPRWSELWPSPSDIGILEQNGDLIPIQAATDRDSAGFHNGETPPTAMAACQQEQHPSCSPNSSTQTSSPGIRSLDRLSESFSFYIGPTGTSDTSLLTRHANDFRGPPKNVATGLSFRPVSADFQNNSTIFGITEHSLIETVEPRPTTEQVQQAWAELWSTVDRKAALQLCRLYFRFINPYFPIFPLGACPENIHSLKQHSLAILAGMCATAVPFMLYDNDLYDVLPRPPSAQRLYRLCWFGICQELHAPTLATVQACLLLQHHLPANPVLSDTAFKWNLTSIALSTAQTIGLNRNPLAWTLVPREDRKLRQRIWWAVWTMEKWVALSRGMPSLINTDDMDVPPLGIFGTSAISTTQDDSMHHFECLTHLTSILDDVRKTYYTVRAESMTATDLEKSLELARPLRARLRGWQDNLPVNLRSWTTAQANISTADPRQRRETWRLDGNASLHLSYIVTHMMLFRALLRPLTRIKSSCGFDASLINEKREGVSAIIKGSIFCARELVDFLEALPDSRWNAFWHCWSRANFAMAGSFIVDLLLTISPALGPDILSSDQMTDGPAMNHVMEDDSQMHAPTRLFQHELQELKHLIERWRWANRVSANGAAGVKGLTTLGLFKVETMLTELRKPWST